MLSWTVILTGIFMAYAVGSLAGGHFLSKILYNADVRQVGSGNAGTMNVLRNLGIAAGIMTFIWDTAKGFLVVTLGLKGAGLNLVSSWPWRLLPATTGPFTGGFRAVRAWPPAWGWPWPSILPQCLQELLSWVC